VIDLSPGVMDPVFGKDGRFVGYVTNDDAICVVNGKKRTWDVEIMLNNFSLMTVGVWRSNTRWFTQW
jgi:Mg/Co/Ni transporter MgtE